MGTSEEYLDKLLWDMSDKNGIVRSENSQDDDLLESSDGDSYRDSMLEDDFLREFDQELETMDVSGFLDELEKELNESNEHPDLDVEPAMFSSSDDLVESLADIMENAAPSNEADSPMSDIMVDTINAPEAEEPDIGEAMPGELLDRIMPEDAGETGYDMAEKELESSLGELEELQASLRELERSIAETEEKSSDPFLKGDTGIEPGEIELMDMDDTEQGMPGLDDISEFDLENAGMEVENPFAGLSDPGAEEEAQAEPEAAGEAADGEEESSPKKKKKREKKPKKEKVKKEKKKKEKKPDKNKESMLAKMSKLLFGEDGEAVSLSTDNPEATALAGENTGAGTGGAPVKPAPKKEKKKKEKKKKEEKPKKEKPKKPPKPKKEKPPKPPKEPDNSPPLPKVPVVMIFIMGASFLALVLLGTSLLGYTNQFAEADKAYAKKNYVEAFAAVSGVKVKEAEADKYEKYKIMAVISDEYGTYNSMMRARMYDMALDSLIRAVGRCEKYRFDAETYGCLMELENIEDSMTSALGSTFGMSKEQALALYGLDDRYTYSVQIYEILKSVGLEMVTEDDSDY